MLDFPLDGLGDAFLEHWTFKQMFSVKKTWKHKQQADFTCAGSNLN